MATMIDFQYYFICFLLWIASTLLLQYLLKKPADRTTHLHLPPSPPALPFIGHIHHLGIAIHESFQKICTKYGPLVYLRLGSYPLLVVSSASVATEIFKTQDLTFASRPKSPFDGILFGDLGFITAPYGDYWRFMKKLCITELLGPGQLNRSRSIRHEELVRFMRKVMEKAQKSEIVDVSAEVTTLTNNITCKMAMSTRCSEEDNEAEKIRELVHRSFKLAIKLAFVNFFGPFKKLSFWIYRKEALEVPKKFDELLERLLKEHEERTKRDGNEGKDKDLMHILLEYHHNKDAEVQTTRSHMKAFFLDILIAGTSTSAGTMEWVMGELINNPDIFKKLRDEIESITGRNRLVEEADVPNLPYLQAVVKEAQRLHPVAPVVPRLCREDCKIGEFDIPKDTSIAMNLYSIMRDPEHWENPTKFHPERFLISSEEQKESKGQDFSFVPFGGGRRICPGANLAYSMIFTTVAAMVQCFDWRVIGGDGAKVNMEVNKGFEYHMAYPLRCIPAIHFNPFQA